MSSGRVTARTRIVSIRGEDRREQPDQLAAEEPMEIRVNGEPVSVTMRTPGADFELAIGFCHSEGLLAGDEVAGARYCAGRDENGEQTFNVVDVATRAARPPAAELRRHVYTASSCGICGTASIDAVRKDTPSVSGDDLRVPRAILSALPERLREAQRVFQRTGGLHAAALFDSAGDLVCAREDVGRHNAVDKVVGWGILSGRLPLSGHVLMVSGRVAFEIVQKALTVQVPMITAVSAPSSLAVDLAKDAGATVVGFLRGERMNVYSAPNRVID